MTRRLHGTSRGAVAVGSAAVLWGSMGPVAALYPDRAALPVAAWRLLIGGAALALGVTLARGWTSWRGRDLPTVLAGISTVAGYSALYFPAVALSGVATATVVSIGGAPVVSGIYSLARGRRPPRRWVSTTLLATVGMTLVVLPGSHHPAGWLGVALAAAAAATYAAQAHLIERLADSYGAAQTVAVLFSASAVILLPAAAGLVPSTAEPAELAGVIYLGLFTTSVAYWLFASGVRQVGASVGVTLSLLEPVAATVLGALVAHQVPTVTQDVGVLITVVALALLSVPAPTAV